MTRRHARVRQRSALGRIELLEQRQLLTGFTAYNGLFPSGLTDANATFFSDQGGRDSAGLLVDVATGEETQVLLSTSQVGVHFGGNGAQPAFGTDAHEIFDSHVDFAAGATRSLEISGGDAYQYTFENLDAGATYEFVGTAVRGNSQYTDRWTLVEIQGAESFTPDHSSGLGVVSDGLPSNQIAIWTGNNVSGGYVAQWRDIDPGADGVFHVISTQYRGPVPTQIDSGGRADGSKGYGISGIRLIENLPAGPPEVENGSPSDVRAFQANIGGRVARTGGQVPDVAIFYGEQDGGSDANAWSNVLPIGPVSRDFEATLDGLNPETTYYYRTFAENSVGSDWADTSQFLTTLAARVPAVEVSGAEGVGAFAAQLVGQITDTGNDPPTVTVYYGESDGGTDPGSWDEAKSLGVQQGGFGATATDLDPDTTYFYRAFAQNVLGGRWSPTSVQFTTTETPPLQVSEFMADNATTITTRVRNEEGVTFRGDALTPDWIELYNPTDTVTDVGGFYLSDDIDDPTRWQIPAGTLVPARGHVVIFASGLDVRDTRLDERGRLHANFELGATAGAEVVLSDGEGEIVASFSDLPAQSEDISYGVDASAVERYYGVPTPGANNANDVPKSPRILAVSQTFTDRLTVEIVPESPTHTIYFTLDEATPTTNSLKYDGPLTVTRTTQLRAISVAPNGKSSNVVGASYVQLATSVTDDASNLPLVVVETFGDGVPGTGSAFGDVFIGIIEPGEEGVTRLSDPFAVETRGGIHVRGSSSAGFAKKQYRVEFWDQQNEDQKHPVLGMPSEADWILYGPGQYDRSLIANPLMFDLSRQIGRYATRTRWVEMYLNSNGGPVSASDYVGVYAITEVIEEGGDRIDVGDLSTGAGGVPVDGGFIWKNDRGSEYVDPEITTSAQRTHISQSINGLRNAAAGANFKDPVNGYAKYADVDSFIDHNILNLFAMNVDALRLSTFYHKDADSELIAGPIWDFDRSLDSTDGRDNNPRSWFGTGDSTRYFDDNDRVMSWWPDMFQDPDFVQQYIDRWFELRHNELSLENINATIDQHADQIREAASRDYSRWSGSRYGNFDGEIRHLKDWIRSRVEWIDAKWLSPPQFDTESNFVPAGTEVDLSAGTGTVYYTLDGSDPRGEDGAISSNAIRFNGPIAVNDYTNVTARVFRSGHGTSNGYVSTGDDWSPAVTGVFFVDQPAAAGKLAVEEINYHPAKPNAVEQAAGFEKDDFEFIELVNLSSERIALTGSRLAKAEIDGELEGVSFDFSTSSIQSLDPGERVVVVENLDAFRARYGDGLPVAGEWRGALSNNRETITLRSFSNELIQQFSYNDSGLWPAQADGEGATLVANRFEGNLSAPESWGRSVRYLGSPGVVDVAPMGVVINEVLTHTDPPLTPSDSIELMNTTSSAIDISGWYLSDSADNLLKFEVPVGTIIPPNAYVVFDESDFNPSPLSPLEHHFALSSARGDDVWLTIAEGERPTVIADVVSFGATPNGESLGRVPNGSGPLQPMRERSLGTPNREVRVGPLVISELHYAPGEPSLESLAIEPTMTSDDLEFIELFNSTGFSVDLTNWRLRGGVDFDFDPGQRIAPGGSLVLIAFDPAKPENASRLASFRAHYTLGEATTLIGGFEGHLNDLGEAIRLQRPDEPPAEDPDFIPRLLEDQVLYDDVAPWPSADGSGSSLTRVHVDESGMSAANWLAAVPSPGVVDFVPVELVGDVDQNGDVDIQDLNRVCSALHSGTISYDLNLDGVFDDADVSFLVRNVLGTTAGDADANGIFDLNDFVLVFVAGEYLDGIDGNSTWSEGDWDCSGDFDTNDIVLAFQSGGYVVSAAKPAGFHRSLFAAAGTHAITDGDLELREGDLELREPNSHANELTVDALVEQPTILEASAVDHLFDDSSLEVLSVTDPVVASASASRLADDVLRPRVST